MKFPKKTRIKNYLNGATYDLVPASEIADSKIVYEQIAAICNQTAVYEYLFRRLLGGKEYSLEMAQGFLTWSKAGWETNSYFVFFITSSDGSIVGCIDIKSNNTTCTEIGYWCSDAHPGIMTNSVIALCAMALQAEFKVLRAEVLKGNTKSSDVLVRSGFKFLELESDSNESHDFYYKQLA